MVNENALNECAKHFQLNEWQKEALREVATDMEFYSRPCGEKVRFTPEFVTNGDSPKMALRGTMSDGKLNVVSFDWVV